MDRLLLIPFCMSIALWIVIYNASPIVFWISIVVAIIGLIFGKQISPAGLQKSTNR